MSLPPTYSSQEQYFEDALSFLKEYEWIYICPNIRILVDDIFTKIPSNWINFFNSIDTNELNGHSFDTHLKVRSQ